MRRRGRCARTDHDGVRADVDRSYVRCLKILFAGQGTPLYGVRPDAQVALAGAGERMGVYVPYGTQWYGYFLRRLAERPANAAFLLRALATRN